MVNIAKSINNNNEKKKKENKKKRELGFIFFPSPTQPPPPCSVSSAGDCAANPQAAAVTIDSGELSLCIRRSALARSVARRSTAVVGSPHIQLATRAPTSDALAQTFETTCLSVSTGFGADPHPDWSQISLPITFKVQFCMFDCFLTPTSKDQSLFGKIL